MGRRRQHNDARQPLPTGLYRAGRQFRARKRTGEWVYFGDDYLEAMRAFDAWRAAQGKGRDVAWLMNRFTGEICPTKVRAGLMAPRTARDYLRDAAMLIEIMGHIPLSALNASHVAGYRDAREPDAPAHVRNELAALSAALSEAVEKNVVARNVAKDVRRPRKQVRERLVTHDEYAKVYAVAGASVRLAMVLAVRTLASPADVLRMGPRNVVKREGAPHTLRWRRGKTNMQVEVEIIGELAAALDPFIKSPTLHPTFVRRNDGKPYTVDGIGAMFRRYCDEGHANVTDFALRDLRAKGATDMYRAGADVRALQRLLGHKSVQTTEIYLKQLLAEIVRPNEVPIIASVK